MRSMMLLAVSLLCGVCGLRAEEIDTFLTPGGKTVTFHALMHASIRIEFDGKEMEIDPVTKLGSRTTDYTAVPQADYIFVTHEHMNHFDREALRMLTGSNTRLITNGRCAGMLGSGEVMATDRRM